jgi:hypothetical protein
MPQRDISNPTDKINPLKRSDQTARTRSKIEALTRRMERQGVNSDVAGSIADRIAAHAEGPIAVDDWAMLDATRFSDKTKALLKQEGLTSDNVLKDADVAESYVSRVLELEGMPDFNGATEKLRGVTTGYYEKRGTGGVGIDLVAADENGVPMPIEVKKYRQASSAHLEDRSVVKLEPEVAHWKTERETRVRARQEGDAIHVSAESFQQRPLIEDWQRQMDKDAVRIDSSDGYLPVQQMDDLWTRDRWLKIIEDPAGRARMVEIGIDHKYLDYDNLRNSPDLPEWQEILDCRTTVIVSDSKGGVGRQLFTQAVRDQRSKSVIKIEV